MEVFMKRRTKTETEKFYRQLLAERRRSGLSIRAFARERGVPAGTLSSWAFELKKRDAARGKSTKSPTKPGFIPVSVVGALASPTTATHPDAPAPAWGGYEVELGAGRVLRLPHDFDEPRAAALVRAVASC
jgi:transposase-like protein